MRLRHSRCRKRKRNCSIYVRNWWFQISSFRVRDLLFSTWRKCSNFWSFTIKNRFDWIARVNFSFLSLFNYRSWRLNEINHFTIEIHQFTSSLINEREELKNSFFSFFVFFFSYEVSWKSKFVKTWMFNKKSFILHLVSNVSCFEKNWDRSTNNTFYNWINDAFQISILIYSWRLSLIMLHEMHDI